MENGRVVALRLYEFGLTGALPAEVGQLTSLQELHLHDNQLTSVPAEIGQLTALEALYLRGNELTSVPAEIGQLTSLEVLKLNGNRLTSVLAEIGSSRRDLRQSLSSRRCAAGVVAPRQSADERAGGDWAAHGAEGVRRACRRRSGSSRRWRR